MSIFKMQLTHPHVHRSACKSVDLLLCRLLFAGLAPLELGGLVPTSGRAVHRRAVHLFGLLRLLFAGLAPLVNELDDLKRNQ